MGTLTAAAVIDRVSTLLQDKDHIRWPEAELLLWISDAQREVGTFKPDALVKTDVLPLVAGTKQSLPADGVVLIDVVRNMGTDEVTPGRVPRVVMREVLDAQMPSWHLMTASAEVKHYVFDPANQRTFYVQPPQPTSVQGSLEVVYSASPANVTTAEQALILDDTWISAMTNYVLYRAYSKDAEYAANANLAVAYYQAFITHMTGRSNAEAMLDPNRNAPIVNPNVRQPGNPNPMAGGQ